MTLPPGSSLIIKDLTKFNKKKFHVLSFLMIYYQFDNIPRLVAFSIGHIMSR
jgi:hypothetical protein